MLRPLLLIFGIFGFLSLEAQLFTVSAAVEDSLTQGEQDFRQRMLDSAYYLSSQSVEIADFQSLLDGDSVNFTIPGMTQTFTASKKFEYNETNYHYDYLWSGRIKDEYPGEFLIVQKDNMIGGFIQTQSKFFTIIPTGENRGLLMEANPLKDADIDCGMIPQSEMEEPEVDPCEDNYNTCSAEIHAMVIITPEHAAFTAGLGHPFVQVLLNILSLEAINIAFHNSDIPNKRVRYSFVSLAFPLSNSMFTDRDNLVADANVKNLRDDRRADVVLMLTGEAHSFPAGLVPSNSYENPDLAYVVVRGPSMFYPIWTIAHEMTHLMRADHTSVFNCCNCISGNEEEHCSHGWRFIQASGSPMSIHAIGQLSSGDHRVLHFSNPDVTFNGLPTGSNVFAPPMSLVADNAKTIRNGACVVADYRSPNAFFTAFLIPPQQVCEDNGTFYINGSANEAAPALIGHPPFTYSFSATGSNCFITSVTSNGAVANIDFVDIPGPSSITIDLVVTSSDGGVAKASETILLTDCLNNNNDPDALIVDSEFFKKKYSSKITEPNQISKSGYQVFPNPTSSNINLAVPRGKENVNLEVMDLTGKVLLKIIDSSQPLIEIDMTNFPNGKYILKVIDEVSISAFKIIKLTN